MTESTTKTLCWYFDFISPFAYLQLQQLRNAAASRKDLVIEYRPVLFAGLLQHHQHKGPAEIPLKRQMTYRYCDWYAKNNDIAFTMPAAHPFNPLPLLRLAIAADCKEEVIAQLFDYVWRQSGDNPAFSTLEEISKLAGMKNAAERVAQPQVKSQLKRNTDEAIARGIFGVPTIAIDEQLFWGMDMTGMALAYVDDPHSINTAEYQRIGDLPIAKVRPG